MTGLSPLPGAGGLKPEIGLPRPDKTHVLGCVFPYSDTDGSRDSELESCFLRLAYAVTRLRLSGANAVGYFALLRPELRDAARRLQSRYEVGDAVHIVFASLLISDMTKLDEAAGLAQKAGNPGVLTVAARQIGAEALRREIATREREVAEQSPPEAAPFGVCWDYCGVARGSVGGLMAEDARVPRLL